MGASIPFAVAREPSSDYPSCMRILLISPGAEDLNLMVLKEVPYLLADAFFAPHACATVAALTPPGHDVVIHDEHLRGAVDTLLGEERFDIIGLSVDANQVGRSLEIAELFQAMGRPGQLAVGGVGASHMSPRLYELADAIFLGEAEQTWPRYLEDLGQGRTQRIYRNMVRPDLAAAPAPRWDLIRDDIPRYSSASVQTSRGCPHDCSFCDVIYTFGRRLRLKPVERVLVEVSRLQSMGVKLLYFADDNFAADRPYIKELLRRLAALNRTFETQLAFMTQVDITVAQDDELLQLMLDANLVEVQIGIESVDPVTLREMNKLQNIRPDPVAAVRKIQSYGIVVLAHMIVGMDSDGPEAFDGVEAFLREAGVVHHLCHPLMAPPGTRLWYQLKRAGRVIDPPEDVRDLMDVTTNIVPARMSRVELMEGLAAHWERVTRPEHWLARALAYLEGITHEPSVKAPNQPSPWRMRKEMASMTRHLLFHVPAGQRKAVGTLMKAAARKDRALIPRAIFAWTFYAMEEAQARIAAGWARRLAARERATPVATLPTDVPIPEAVRDQAGDILRAAYLRVRPRVARKERLYRTVAGAVLDYLDRFGATFQELDETQRQALHASCDRILARLPHAEEPGAAAEESELPAHRPPAGFTRELLDALDRELRVVTARKVQG